MADHDDDLHRAFFAHVSARVIHVLNMHFPSPPRPALRPMLVPTPSL